MNLNLESNEFENYLVRTIHKFGGVMYRFKFDNNYGASVVKHSGSYGSEKDLWELAVLSYDEHGESQFASDTGISEDVEGYLTDEDVRDLLGRIKKLA